MGIFKKLAKAVIDTALTPVEVVRDVADGEVPFTARRRGSVATVTLRGRGPLYRGCQRKEALRRGW